MLFLIRQDQSRSSAGLNSGPSGLTGSSRDGADRDNKERPEKLLSEMKTGKLLTLTQFIEMAETFRKQLDQKPYGERTQSPAEYYKNFNKHTVEPHVLDLLLMKEKENIKVTTQGIKIFGGLFYQSSTLMANVPVGEKVSVRYDDNDLSYVIVWYGKKCLGRVPVDERVSMAGGRFDVGSGEKGAAVPTGPAQAAC